jgi:DNA (cytosine-5)-methyltransferase 1
VLAEHRDDGDSGASWDFHVPDQPHPGGNPPVWDLAAHDGGRTWQVIVERLRELGYKVSSKPLVFSPHLLPPELGGAPQFRERVFVLAEHRDYGDSGASWDFHVPNQPHPGWNPQDWDLVSWLERHPALEADLDPYAWREDRRQHARAWGELLAQLPPGRVPQPLQEYAWKLHPDLEGLPRWKQRHNQINSDFYREHRKLLDAWRRKHRPERWIMSDRKLEWQAQDARREHPEDVFDLQLQFRPSGLRVKKPTYAGALVAITQTPYMGWLERSLTPTEAATLQGIPVHDPVAPYRLHETPAVAFKQLGNGVNVGVVRHLMRALFDYTGFTAARPAVVSLTEPASRPRVMEALSA